MITDHPAPSGESERLVPIRHAEVVLAGMAENEVLPRAYRSAARYAADELARLRAEVARLTAERDAWRDPVLDGWAVYSEIPESGRYPMGAGVSLVLDAVARLARRALTTEGGDRE